MIIVIVSQSILWAAAAALLVLAPQVILGWFDVQQQETIARVFGAELAGLALVSYFTRQLARTPQRRDLAIAYTVSNTLGTWVTASSIMNGSMGRFTWILTGLYLIYALAFAYYLFSSLGTSPGETARGPR